MGPLLGARRLPRVPEACDRRGLRIPCAQPEDRARLPLPSGARRPDLLAVSAVVRAGVPPLVEIAGAPRRLRALSGVDGPLLRRHDGVSELARGLVARQSVSASRALLRCV